MNVRRPQAARSDSTAPTPRRGPAGEHGFSLVEVSVGMVLLAIVLLVALALILHTLDLTASNARRVVAASLAAGELESARALPGDLIPHGRHVRMVTVDGVPYTVTRTANEAAADAVNTVCSGTGDRMAHKVVTVTVTWPDMGRVPPVRVDTLRRLTAGHGSAPATGTLALALTDGTGGPVEGVTVTLDGDRSVVTGVDGCAAFTGLPPGPYTATVDEPDHVDQQNSRRSELTALSVSAGRVTRAVLPYDRGRSLGVWPKAVPGFVEVPGLALTVRDAYIEPGPLPDCSLITGRGCAYGFPDVLQSLFPAVYSVHAGTCADAGVAPTQVDLTPEAADGQVVEVEMGRVVVDVRAAAGPVAGRVVYAVHAADPAGTRPGCPGGEVHALPASVVGGARLLLPFGSWTFSAEPVPAPGSPTVTLTPGTVATVTVAVP